MDLDFNRSEVTHINNLGPRLSDGYEERARFVYVWHFKTEIDIEPFCNLFSINHTKEAKDFIRFPTLMF